MDHINDSQMLELLAGHIAPDQQKGMHEHMDACAPCRARWQDYQGTWEDLGQWDLQPPQLDLTESIMARIPSINTVRLFQPRSLLRIAASVLIGLLVGRMAARTPYSGHPSEQDMAQVMYLDTLSLNSSTGFGDPLLQSSTANDGIEP